MAPRGDKTGNTALDIAVVGSGISGLAAAWLLSHKHRVSLFEANGRLGGHTNTVRVTLPGPANSTRDEDPVAVDTGFIVFNEKTYPNLCALFDHIDVAHTLSDMSFAVSADRHSLLRRFEYNGGDLAGLIAQKRNLLRPRFWSMVSNILRFYKNAAQIDLETDDTPVSDQTLGDYLSKNGYSAAFARDHIIPMAAAIWSSPESNVDAFPFDAFLRFNRNHGLMQVKDRPAWRTVVGGSQTYISKLIEHVENIYLSRPISRLTRRDGKVHLETKTGETHTFDRVLVAAHADEALAMLDSPTEQERSLLGAFDYTENHAVLHTDTNLMPKSRKAWASWNVLTTTQPRYDERGKKLAASGPMLTYWMNKLQPLTTDQNVFVSLNPGHIDPDKILFETNYKHPFFNPRAMAAQKQFWHLQGTGGVWFAGAHFGYGFHEDGLQAGLKAAEEMGDVRRPWDVDAENDRILSLKPFLASARKSEALA